MDRYEVTNIQFKKFVDAGGYRKSEYWKQPFVDNGKILSWEKAMSRFLDKAGRPGPTTWELGNYPEGQGDYPVTGVSWYEAAAYAEFTREEFANSAPMAECRVAVARDCFSHCAYQQFRG